MKQNQAIKSHADLYRFYSIPSNLLALLEHDKIDISCKQLSIEKILEQRGLNDVDPKYYPEPYFSLYKINNALNNKLWPSDTNTFNDIHETIVWIDDQNLMKSVAKRRGEHSIQTKRMAEKRGEINIGLIRHNSLDVYQKHNNYGAICFCKAWNKQLMWGHYANGHYGICVGYKINKRLLDTIAKKSIILQEYDVEKYTFFLLFSSINYYQSPIIWSDKIRDQWRDEYQYLCRNNPTISKLIGSDDYGVMRTQMFSKSEAWKDEEEQRMIILGHPRESISIEKLISDTAGTPYIEMVEVICGNKVDKNITTILQNSKKSDLKFMRAIPKGGTFECELSKI